jgi:hypothetical protein
MITTRGGGGHVNSGTDAPSFGGSARYTVRNLRCTVTIDSVLENCKTEDSFLSSVYAMFRHDSPPAVKPASTPRRLLPPKNLERFSTSWYAPFCCVCLGCCAADFGSSGGTYELSCISLQSRTTSYHVEILPISRLREPAIPWSTEIWHKHLADSPNWLLYRTNGKMRWR